MSDVNPYSPPLQASCQPAALPADLVGQALYCKGRLLVMHRLAVLPDRCVKSNQAAHGRRLRRKLYWHHPAVFLSLLLNLIIYVILAMCLRKTARIDIGLSDQWYRKRRRGILIGWLLFLGGLASLFVAAAYTTSPNLPGVIFLGVILSLIGAFYGLFAARLVVAARITDDYIWLKGVHPDFLAELPPWPHNP